MQLAKTKITQERNEKMMTEYAKIKQETGRTNEDIADELGEKYFISDSVVLQTIWKYNKQIKECPPKQQT